jgi:tetratricopeptide (TPR) repeat protein
MADAGELLKGSPENLDALLLSADCHLALPFRDSFLRRLRLINEVIGPLTRYLEKASNDGRALCARGFVYFATTDLNEAATDLRAAVSANPNNMDGHALLAEIYRTLKDTWQAIDEADSVLSRSPAHLRAQLTRLELFADSNRWDEIVVVAPQLQRVAPDNPRVIELVGKALNLTNRPSAVLQFQGKHAPGTPAWLAETRAIARAQFALRDLGGALKHCDEVLSKVPADSEANILRIEALAASGRWEEVLSAGVAAYKIVPVGTSESHEMLRFLRTAYKIRSAKGGGQTANGAAPPPDGQALSPNTTSAATDSVI